MIITAGPCWDIERGFEVPGRCFNYDLKVGEGILKRIGRGGGGQRLKTTSLSFLSACLPCLPCLLSLPTGLACPPARPPARQLRIVT